MENEFILDAGGIQPQAMAEIQSWQPSPVYPLSHANGWDASAFNPTMSSPVGSNTPFVSNDGVHIRELIRKLDGFGGNPEEIAGSSCYSTPLSSPLNFGKSVAPGVKSNLAEFPADLGFVERAARFSCFGSRSFNGRTGPYIGGQVEFHQGHSSEFAAAGDVRQGRVSSNPSPNGLGVGPRPGIDIRGPLWQLDGINSTGSPEEQSSVIEPVPSCEMGPRNSIETNPRKRKGVANRGKAKEPAADASKEIRGESSNAKRCKSSEGDDRDKQEGGGQGEGEEKQNKREEKPVEPPKDYIHVRARRGQATDSHSLAERVRREKISERMKLLQDLVPSCNKVTGKALMLDEIINYVQSLQRQVEFLSMKLASVNTSLDVANADSLMSMDHHHHHHHHMFPSNSALPHHMLPGDAPQTAAADPHGRRSHRPLDSRFAPSPGDLPYQGFSSGGDDLHTVVQMGLGQSSLQDTTTSFRPQIFHY